MDTGTKTQGFSFKNIICLIMSAMIFAVPFIDGISAPKTAFIFKILFMAVSIIWVIYKIISKEKLIVNTLLAVPALLIVAGFIISFATGSLQNPDYITQYFCCFAVFIVMSDLAEDSRNIFIFFNALAFSVFISGLLSFDSALGAWAVNSLGFSKAVFDGIRATGILGDAGTSSFLFALAAFSFIILSLAAEKRMVKLIYTALISPSVIYMCLGMSVVPVLTFIAVYVITFFIIKEKEFKVEFMVYSLIPIISGFIFFVPVYKTALELISVINIPDEILLARNAATSYLAVSIATSFCSIFILAKKKEALASITNKTYIKYFSIAFFALAVGFIVLFPTGLYEMILPQSLISAIQSFTYDVSAMPVFLSHLKKDSGFIGMISITAIALLLISLAFRNRGKGQSGFVHCLMFGVTSILLTGLCTKIGYSYFGILLIFFSLLGITDKTSIYKY